MDARRSLLTLDQLLLCNETLEYSIQYEYNRVSTILESNRLKVLTAQDTQQQCSQMLTDSLTAIIEWQDAQPFDLAGIELIRLLESDRRSAAACEALRRHGAHAVGGCAGGEHDGEHLRTLP